MPTVSARSVLTGFLAAEIMRRQIVRLTAAHSVADGIRRMIKHRANAVIVDDGDGAPVGVVSKTDTMLAYYGGLSPQTPIGDIMMGPVHTCFRDDTLEWVLAAMQREGVHQLFVRGAAGEIAAVISYGDIVGLVYRTCRACERSRRKHPDARQTLPALRVRDVMSAPVAAVESTDTLATVMDVLTANRMGAVPVIDAGGLPVGAISKTDLARAYLHGAALDTAAAAIMTSPVTTCAPDALLSEAVQTMLLCDIQRVFVRKDARGPVTGVLALSDAARFRSGTCRACTTSRLMTDH